MTFTTDSTRWEALRSRDPAAHSSFIYAVKTTRIFCRPTCPARLARRAHVIFFATSADAVKAGFRPCKRCQPDTCQPTVVERHSELVQRACAIIQSHHGRIPFKNVAKQIGFSSRYLQGIFKEVMGMTVGRYATECSRSCTSLSESEPSLSLSDYHQADTSGIPPFDFNIPPCGFDLPPCDFDRLPCGLYTHPQVSLPTIGDDVPLLSSLDMATMAELEDEAMLTMFGVMPPLTLESGLDNSAILCNSCLD